MITKALPLLLVASYSLIQGIISICPNEEFIQPCSCTPLAFGNHVVCNRINSTELIQDIFRVLSPYEINTLLFSSLRIANPISPSIFSGIKINNLRFEDSEFTLSNEQPLFTGLEHYLNVLDISNCHIKQLDDVTFKHLSLLTEVALNFDHVHSVGSNWFREGPSNLQILRLDHNNISSITECVFCGLTNLEKIFLADNNMERISRVAFPRFARKLSWLDLSYNKLTTLPTNMFEKMPQLRQVVLTKNRFQSLPEDTWKRVWGQLEFLVLQDNPIQCDNRIKWAVANRRFNLNGSCIAPKQLNGTRLELLTEDQLPAR